MTPSTVVLIGAKDLTCACIPKKVKSYPKVQSPRTQYLHRCKASHCEHSPNFFLQSRRLVFATMTVSRPKVLLATAFSFPSWTAILPSSDRMRCFTASATVKLFETVWSSVPKSKHPWCSHRILVTYVDMPEAILNKTEQFGSTKCAKRDRVVQMTRRSYGETKTKLRVACADCTVMCLCCTRNDISRKHICISY